MKKYVIMYEEMIDLEITKFNILDNLSFDNKADAGIIMRKRLCSDMLRKIKDIPNRVPTDNIDTIIAEIENNINFAYSDTNIDINISEDESKLVVHWSSFGIPYNNTYKYKIDVINID